MRTTACVVVLGLLLAVVTAFATAPAIADMQSGPVKEQPGMTGQEKGKMTGEMKGMMTGQTRGETPMKSKTKMSREKGVVGKATGGQAFVARVDRPENCLRVRSGPGRSYETVGCAAKGDTLLLTGVFSKDGRWAQLDNSYWVFFDQLRTDVRPPQVMASEGSFDQPATAGKKSRKGYKRYHRFGKPYKFYYGPGYYYGYGCPGYFYGYRYGHGMFWYPY